MPVFCAAYGAVLTPDRVSQVRLNNNSCYYYFLFILLIHPVS